MKRWEREDVAMEYRVPGFEVTLATCFRWGKPSGYQDRSEKIGIEGYEIVVRRTKGGVTEIESETRKTLCDAVDCFAKHVQTGDLDRRMDRECEDFEKSARGRVQKT